MGIHINISKYILTYWFKMKTNHMTIEDLIKGYGGRKKNRMTVLKMIKIGYKILPH